MKLAPDIFHFDDHRAYMQAWYVWKKDTNPKYSHRLFARSAGRAGDAGLLRNIITGRRALTRALVDDVGVALELTRVEVEYLGVFAELDRARGTSAEAGVRERLSSEPRARQQRRRQMRIEQYLTIWYVPVIRELARVDSFQAHADWIADRVVPAITVDQASKALTILHDLGHLSDKGQLIENEHGDWNRSRDKRESLSYQQDLHATAGRALQQVARNGGHVPHTSGMVVAVPRDKLAAVQAELEAVQQRLAARATGYDDPDTVVQVVLQAFPVVAEPLG
ncbi:MAG: hypothetical protein ACI9MC_002723 [Kiritimatiellia bacterium]